MADTMRLPLLVDLAIAHDGGPLADQEWRGHARCRGVDPEVFMPPRGASLEPALAYCRGCEVREPCLQYALDHGETFGVWGGTAERRGAAPGHGV